MPTQAVNPSRPARYSRRSLSRVAMVVVGAMAALVAIAVATPSSAATASLSGTVRSGPTGLADFDVELVQAGTDTAAPNVLGTTTTASDGTFALGYTAPADPSAQLYLRATGASAGPAPQTVTFISALGPTPVPATVVVDELTTVAAAFALAQFTDGSTIAGPAPGLPNAISMAHNLADPSTGGVAAVLDTHPNGDQTDTRRTFRSLGNMLAACVADSTACDSLFAAATPPAGSAPTDTYAAIVDVAQNPSDSVGDLFTVSQLPPMPYTPALVTQPDGSWIIALRFDGDGHSIDGPGNIAIDHDGNLWVNNNYNYAPDATTAVCGSDSVFKFTPDGQFWPGSPYTGGGLSGAGFGIGLDIYGDVWVGNFGFASPPPGCAADQQPPHNSVSQFHPDGTPVSPAGTGWTQGNLSWPQATLSDTKGNIWIANCGNDTVTIYPDGDPTRAKNIGDLGIQNPFGIAFAPDGTAFVTGMWNDTIAMIGPDGTPVAGSPLQNTGLLNGPMGIAADSQGNMWVANSGLSGPPCPQLTSAPTNTEPSVAVLRPDGTPLIDHVLPGGGALWPWGIAVDGNDNVWVANFAGRRVSELCGVQVVGCLPGTSTGDPISPDNGYAFNGLTRDTGLAIDPSGNVWIVNNWKDVPIQTNPGGYEIVALLGLAGPVQTPAPVPRPTTAPAEPIAAAPRFTG